MHKAAQSPRLNVEILDQFYFSNWGCKVSVWHHHAMTHHCRIGKAATVTFVLIEPKTHRFVASMPHYGAINTLNQIFVET